MDKHQIPGSKWWKCDLHVHTPGSDKDYPNQQVTPEDIVEAALGKGLEAIAVTDHNGFGWIAKVRAAAGTSLSLKVFAGVEVTAQNNHHLLVIFDTATPETTVNGFLGKCGVLKDYGDPESRADLSFQQVFKNALEAGALCIPAHVDGPRGLLAELVTPEADGSLTGNGDLLAFLRSPDLLAVEIKDDQSALLGYLRNAETAERFHAPITRVESSDAHSVSDIGQRFTWIKMTEPSLDGLKLALMDGAGSVVPGRQAPAEDLNREPELYLESIEIADALYLGKPEPLKLSLSPWMNALIGGRGTGKSTVVEFLRAAMRRDREHEKLSKELQVEYAKYKRLYRRGSEGKGLLREETRISAVVRKDAARFRVNWNHDGTAPAIEEWREGQWQVSPGEVASRFPIRIFSQKQVFDLANRPNALLQIIDDHPDVGKVEWSARFEQTMNEFLQLRARIRQLRAECQQKVTWEGKLSDLKRQVAAFEEGQHRAVLTRYQRVERQVRALETWADSLREVSAELQTVPERVVVPDLPKDEFSELDTTDAAAKPVLEALQQASDRLEKVRRVLQKVAAYSNQTVERVEAALNHSTWRAHVDQVRADFEESKRRLAESGFKDVSQYGRLLQERRAAETALQQLGEKEKLIGSLAREAKQKLADLFVIRQEITESRRRFLAEVLRGNELVQIEVMAFGDRKDAAERLRTLLGVGEDTRFSEDLDPEGEEGKIAEVYAGGGDWLKKWSGLCTEIANMLLGGNNPKYHGKLSTYLQRQGVNNPEWADRVQASLPEDSLRISYRPAGSRDWRQIEEGSPGQKSAAILAFLLSHGREPLVLDQPEDDLDNRLISELVVTQLKHLKTRRQIIVVTHNPNIVVNGDAEMIVPFAVAGGQSSVAGAGGLQERTVREQICLIMEGGRDALVRRFRRIAGGSHV